MKANDSKQGIANLSVRPKVPKKLRFFGRYPEHIRARAMEHLGRLMVKHKAKLAKRGMLAILTAVATHMALRDFNLITSYRDAARRLYARSSAKRSLMARAQAINLAPSTDKLTVSHTNLEGI